MKHIRYYAIGHSYLLHGPFVGWQTDGYWGMAATSPVKDYFHTFSKMLEEGLGAKVEAVAENHADFERCCRVDATRESLMASKNYAHMAEVLQNFKPNVISVLLGENAVAKDEKSLGLFFETLYEMINKYKRKDATVICASASNIINSCRPVAEKYGFVVCNCSIIHLDEDGRRPYYALEDYPEYDEKVKMGGVEFRTHPGDAGHEKIASILYENAKDEIAKKIADGDFLEEYTYEEYKAVEKIEKFMVKTEPEFFVEFGGFNIRQEGNNVCFSSAPGTGASVSSYGICLESVYKKFCIEMSVGGAAKEEELLLTINTSRCRYDYTAVIPDDKMRRYEFDISETEGTIVRFFVSPKMDECFIKVKKIEFC